MIAYFVIVILLVIIACIAYDDYRLRKYSVIRETSVHLVSKPVIHKCQFCNNELDKVKRTADGYWCCPACHVKHFASAQLADK